jgi:hypothetical protein
MTLRRPVGLIFLAGASFLICILFVVCGVALLFELFRSLRHVPGSREYYTLGYVLMFLPGFSSFVAAWIAVVAGLDLWRFKMRGRLLTLAAALFSFLFAVFLTSPAFWTGFTIAICSLAVALYIRLPRVHSLFRGEPSEQKEFRIFFLH